MSEYRYYAFQAIDRPLGEADREALRRVSTRATITATSFTNAYEWGDLKGDPAEFMGRWFDLHVYLASWGQRRLMIRLPARLVERDRFDALLRGLEFAALATSGENLILDIDLIELEFDDWDDGSSWLEALAPLRDELLAGDLRLFYLLWLVVAQTGACEADTPEPMAGIGPLSAAQHAFAEFIALDLDLVAAAAERPAFPQLQDDADEAVRIISAMPDADRTAVLARLWEGDPHIRALLRKRVRESLAAVDKAPPPAPRTVGELIARAAELRTRRERARAEQIAREERRRAEAEKAARLAKRSALLQRGESVWSDIEAEIQLRLPKSYDKAVELLLDLRAIAEEDGLADQFQRRLRAIRARHAQKRTFIERLRALE